MYTDPVKGESPCPCQMVENLLLAGLIAQLNVA